MVKFEHKKEKKDNKLAVIITGLIVLAVLLAGPVAAFSVNWSSNPTSPRANQEVEVTVTINKNTTEAINDFVIKVGPDGGTLVEITSEDNDLSCTNDYPALGYSYGGYGYGYGYNQYGEKGYGYSYGYGVGYTDAIVCTFTYTPTSANTDYVGQVWINDVLTNEDVVFTTARASSGIRMTTTSPTGTTTPPGTTVETVYESTNTVTYNPAELKAVLSNMTDDEGNPLFTEQEIAEMIANSEKYEFEIEVKVDKLTDAQGNVSYRTTITTTITNNTDKDQKNVKVVIEVPKAVSETAAAITSGTIFTVLKEDPVLEFTLPLLRVGQTQTITYQTTDTTQPELDGVTFNEPTVKFAEEVETPIAQDPVTTGTDANPTGTTDTTTPTGTDYTLLIILVVILIVVGIAYYKREDIKKMMKK